MMYVYLLGQKKEKFDLCQTQRSFYFVELQDQHMINNILLSMEQRTSKIQDGMYKA